MIVCESDIRNSVNGTVALVDLVLLIIELTEMWKPALEFGLGPDLNPTRFFGTLRRASSPQNSRDGHQSGRGIYHACPSKTGVGATEPSSARTSIVWVVG